MGAEGPRIVSAALSRTIDSNSGQLWDTKIALGEQIHQPTGVVDDREMAEALARHEPEPVERLVVEMRDLRTRGHDRRQRRRILVELAGKQTAQQIALR